MHNFKQNSFPTSLSVSSHVDLVHLFPMHPFPTPENIRKTLQFSDVFREWRKGALRTNRLIKFRTTWTSHTNKYFGCGGSELNKPDKREHTKGF